MKIIPVIHHLTNEISMTNASLCSQEGAYGVFLISMSGENNDLPMLAKAIKGKFPKLKVGLNLLGETAIEALLISLDFNLDMTWSDNPIVTSSGITAEAMTIVDELSGKNHLFFNSVAFKYQKNELYPGQAALFSKDCGFIPTTSGKATGESANLDKIKEMKLAINDYPLAIASGLSPENVEEYLPFVEYGLVSTRISDTFHEFNREKIRFIVSKGSSLF
ncbi:hypothetical protein GW796_10870 [archaeon]|nr:hypothetical protein [archaeon]